MRDVPLGLTFDDVLLVPQESAVLPSGVQVTSRLTKQIQLEVPIVAAAMDTVTTVAMAKAIAREGGIGILHRNCTIEQQVQMVKEAKEENVLVGAAIGPHDLDRAGALDAAGADVIAVDCAHAHKPDIVESVRKIKEAIQAQLIVGNIATADAARAFLPYVDALKVGIGPGAICTTRIISGVGVPQLTAIMEVAAVAKENNVPVIADGGIKYSGDIVKALAAGASSVMLGSLLAGTDEAPGEIVAFEEKKYKAYRGMGSLGAMLVGKSSDRYFQKGSEKYIPEGVEALAVYKGSVKDNVLQLIGGLRAGMGYVGAENIAKLQERAQFVRITQAGRRESHPHSVVIEKQAPNYDA